MNAYSYSKRSIDIENILKYFAEFLRICRKYNKSTLDDVCGFIELGANPPENTIVDFAFKDFQLFESKYFNYVNFYNYENEFSPHYTKLLFIILGLKSPSEYNLTNFMNVVSTKIQQGEE